MKEKKVVLQKDLSRHIIGKYPSLQDAARSVGGEYQHIWKCCVGAVPTAYGFIWRYADDEDDLDDLEYSMVLERAYGEITNLINIEKTRGQEQKRIAREEGRSNPLHLSMVMDALKKVKDDFRKRSDEAYLKHRETHQGMDDDGCINLVNAIIKQAVMDYEEAIVNKDDGLKSEVEFFAMHNAGKYTSVDLYDVFDRIDSDYKKFVKKANESIDGIIEVTNKFRHTKRALSDPANPYRCPFCGGGMHIKGKLKTNSFLVACSGCNLTEVVTVHK